jgi:Zn-dependent protease/CBS domain-containing protein
MGSSLRIGRIGGVAIELHLSWLVIGFLVAYSLAAVQLPAMYTGWSAGAYWAVGIVTSILFLVSVLIHELSHALLARRFGLPVATITLFVFGGAANLGEEPKTPREEALIAAVGPLSSLLLGGILWVIDIFVAQEQLAATIGWLAFINLSLGIFNLVPGFPMDGGRILRALLWRLRGDRFKATRNAAGVGRLVGYLIVAVGVLIALAPGGLVAGIWLALIGWFLSTAAESTVAQMGVQRRLQGVRVRDVMDPDPPSVQPNESVADLVQERMLRGEHRTFLVRHDDGGLAGIVSLTDVRKVPREVWDSARVTDIMTRYNDLAIVRPEDDAEDALRLLQERGVNQLPVVEEGRSVAGMLTRAGVLALIDTRVKLGV